MADNSRAINRVFTRGVISDLIVNGTNEVFDYVVREYIDEPESKTHGEIISEIYLYLNKQKRNEYFYVNTLLNRLLVGIHSVNTTTALSQVRIAHRIADFVMINGEGRAYEIKTPLDNFDRLSDQLKDYFKAFSKVSLLTSSPNEFEKVVARLDQLGDMGEAVGVYHMNDEDIYFNRSYRRNPKQFNEYLEHHCVFKLLRKNEYESIIKNCFNELPCTEPVFYFKTCLAMFEQIPILVAQDLAFKELKKRNKITKIEFNMIPDELKSVIYFSNLSSKMPQLMQLLETNYRR